MLKEKNSKSESEAFRISSFIKKITDNNNRTSIYCDPIFIEELQNWVIRKSKIPENWLVIGQPWVQNTIASNLKVDKIWIQLQIKSIIENEVRRLKEDEKDVKGKESTKYYDEFINVSGRMEVYYSPYIIEQLKSRRRQS